MVGPDQDTKIERPRDEVLVAQPALVGEGFLQVAKEPRPAVDGKGLKQTFRWTAEVRQSPEPCSQGAHQMIRCIRMGPYAGKRGTEFI